jgi:pimeloyl-ACP methyl ester carboxylesterase
VVVFLAVCTILFLIIFHNFLVSRFLEVDTSPDEIQYCLTDDHWRLAISRYKPSMSKFREPVILCHGLGANRYNMDFGENYSLARYLRGRGFDVWVAELRGVGLSSHPRMFSKYQYGYTFDDFANHDAPAIVAAALRETGAEKAMWVGHSMGGMIGYCFLQEQLAAKIKGFVAVASPPSFDPGGAHRIFKRMLKALSIFPAIHTEQLGRFFAPYSGLIPHSMNRTFINPSNVTPDTMRRLMANVPANISRGVLRQFMRWLERGNVTSGYGQKDYTDGMKEIVTPIYMISGGGDRIVPPRLVKQQFDRITSKDKTYKCFSKADGCRVDYGHGDILLGVTAPIEVYPDIAKWLEERADRIEGQKTEVEEG